MFLAIRKRITNRMYLYQQVGRKAEYQGQGKRALKMSMKYLICLEVADQNNFIIKLVVVEDLEVKGAIYLGEEDISIQKMKNHGRGHLEIEGKARIITVISEGGHIGVRGEGQTWEIVTEGYSSLDYQNLDIQHAYKC
uniref:Uncharacterized protein n=1 Tax=Micrurus carvalhoi TaxID=3147026 RepID=A0A2H6ND22_9SAUR